jgi:hypothetical protein
MIATSQPTIINSSVVSAELDGEMVLLDIESGIYFGIDPVGTIIWNKLSEGADVEVIISSILSEYDIDADTVRADVATFIETLRDKNLIVPNAA